MGSSVTFQLS